MEVSKNYKSSILGIPPFINDIPHMAKDQQLGIPPFPPGCSGSHHPQGCSPVHAAGAVKKSSHLVKNIMTDHLSRV